MKMCRRYTSFCVSQGFHILRVARVPYFRDVSVPLHFARDSIFISHFFACHESRIVVSHESGTFASHVSHIFVSQASHISASQLSRIIRVARFADILYVSSRKNPTYRRNFVFVNVRVKSECTTKSSDASLEPSCATKPSTAGCFCPSPAQRFDL